jgi:hypothetical protein
MALWWEHMLLPSRGASAVLPHTLGRFNVVAIKYADQFFRQYACTTDVLLDLVSSGVAASGDCVRAPRTSERQKCRDITNLGQCTVTGMLA